MTNVTDLQNHFNKADSKIAGLLASHEIPILVRNTDYETYFQKLCYDIIGQQLSNKVASVIEGRFNDLFTDEKITAQSVSDIDPQKLRDVGMAWSKVRAIQDLAAKALSGEIEFNKFSELDPDQIITELIKVKGIGTWTAEMFLIFTLGYEDVFSIKDLGLKNGAIKLYGLRGKDKVIEQKILKLSKKWTPYRSYASLLLWRSLDN
jgi:DNA-3-methyladenine glycosylase II